MKTTMIEMSKIYKNIEKNKNMNGLSTLLLYKKIKIKQNNHTQKKKTCFPDTRGNTSFKLSRGLKTISIDVRLILNAGNKTTTELNSFYKCTDRLLLLCEGIRPTSLGSINITVRQCNVTSAGSEP